MPPRSKVTNTAPTNKERCDDDKKQNNAGKLTQTTPLTSSEASKGYNTESSASNDKEKASIDALKKEIDAADASSQRDFACFFLFGFTGNV